MLMGSPCVVQESLTKLMKHEGLPLVSCAPATLQLLSWIRMGPRRLGPPYFLYAAVYFTCPPTRTVSARPRTFQPANGQLRLLERKRFGSMTPSAFGSMTVTSATAPG